MGIKELNAHALVTSSNAAALDAAATERAKTIVAAKVNAELKSFHDDEKVDFIRALEDHGNVARACTLCGISRTSAIEARRRDPLFAGAWHEALEAHVDDVEEAMFKRAKDPSSANTVAGIFLMKSRRRSEYGERLEVDHKVSGKVDIVVDLTNAPPNHGEVVDAEIVEPGAPAGDDEA